MTLFRSYFLQNIFLSRHNYMINSADDNGNNYEDEFYDNIDDEGDVTLIVWCEMRWVLSGKYITVLKVKFSAKSSFFISLKALVGWATYKQMSHSNEMRGRQRPYN